MEWMRLTRTHPDLSGAQLQRLLAAALSVRAADLSGRQLQGPALGQALRKARIAAIHAARQAPQATT